MLKRFAMSAVLACALTLPASADDIITIDAADASIAWQELVGRKVLVTGGFVGVSYMVGKKYPKAFYGRQGMKAIFIDAAGVDAATAATLDADCRPYTEEQLAACAYDVTGLVSANSAGDGPKLSEPQFVRR